MRARGTRSESTTSVLFGPSRSREVLSGAVDAAPPGDACVEAPQWILTIQIRVMGDV